MIMVRRRWGRWGGHLTNHCCGVGPKRSGVGSVAHIDVLYTTPAPPPLLTTDNETPWAPRFAGGLTLDAVTLHETLGHVSTDILRDTCREHCIPTPRTSS